MNQSHRVHDVVVVGAGMAGLTAARRLHELGCDVAVVDKGRAVGGRMATRRFGGARFDHGAQHFSARSAAMRDAVARWQDGGVVGVWFESQSITQPGRGIEPRYLGRDGMRGVAEHVGRGLTVYTDHLVERIDVDADKAHVRTRTSIVSARAVVLTPPVPQTLALLDRSGVRLPASDRAALAAIDYDATLAVLAVLDEPSGLSDGHAALEDGPIAWVADNQHKGVSTVPALTIHSSAGFASAHLEGDVAQWAAELSDAAVRQLGVSVAATHGHRWRYAQPRSTLDVGVLVADATRPVVIAGEVLAGARVEGAFLSGTAAADAVAARLG